MRGRTAELSASNEQLLREIAERKQTEKELQISRTEIRLLSKKLMQAQEQERMGLSVGLHEGLAQYVASVKMGVESLSKLADMQDQRVRGVVNDIDRKLDVMMADIRLLVSRLRPRMLDEIGLASAMESYVGSFEEETGIKCEWECEIDDRKYNQEATTCLYRVMQEALSNTYHHAGASRAKIGLYLQGQFLLLVVEDDGRGFEPSKIDIHAGLGLIGMRERVEQISGTVTIRTEPGKGTRIEARVPIG
ncbi:MAG: sensor histidine kinase [Candidatus Lindowbacteria bacterium]|nr:sensor histidine kinase [Candidatus Lindowbacteria bacterium]